MVTLRKYTISDVNDLAILANNKRISDNLSDMMPYPYTQKDAEDFVSSSLTDSDKMMRRVIVYNGKFCGTIGLHRQGDIYRVGAEMGYWVGEPYWNEGIISAAIPLMIKLGFAFWDIERIYAGVFDYNKASARALEKSGFKYEGTLRSNLIKHGKVYDELKYSILRSEV